MENIIIHETFGSPEIILFDALIVYTDKKCIIPPTTIFCRGEKYNIDTVIIPYPYCKKVWFNFNNYTTDEENLTQGAFLIFWIDDNGNANTVRYRKKELIELLEKEEKLKEKEEKLKKEEESLTEKKKNMEEKEGYLKKREEELQKKGILSKIRRIFE